MTKYKDVVSTHEEYLDLQAGVFESHEGNSPRIIECMRRAYTWFLEHDSPSDGTRILDAACGDGTSLEIIQNLGHYLVMGIEYNPNKVAMAREKVGRYDQVVRGDMHNMDMFDDESFDAVISSHTLEHMYDVEKVVKEFHRVLAPRGRLYVILPYPDGGDPRAHGGKFDLGTEHQDNGKKVKEFFESHGFNVDHTHFDSQRESEVWLWMTKR